MEHYTIDRDQLLLSLLEHETPYLRSCARSGVLDFDDLYQDAAVKIMKILDRYLDQVRSLQAYVSVSMHNLVADRANEAKKRCAVSLDMPFSDSLAMGDLLFDPYNVDPLEVVLVRESLVELWPNVCDVHNPATRKKLREMCLTALASVSEESYS